MKATQVRAVPSQQQYHCCVCGLKVIAFYGIHGYHTGTCSKQCEEKYPKDFYPKQFGPKEME